MLEHRLTLRLPWPVEFPALSFDVRSGPGFGRSDARNELGGSAFSAIREVLMNHTPFCRFVEVRCQSFQFDLCFCFVARSNCSEELFLLAFKTGQNAFVP